MVDQIIQKKVRRAGMQSPGHGGRAVTNFRAYDITLTVSFHVLETVVVVTFFAWCMVLLQ